CHHVVAIRRTLLVPTFPPRSWEIYVVVKLSTRRAWDRRCSIQLRPCLPVETKLRRRSYSRTGGPRIPYTRPVQSISNTQNSYLQSRLAESAREFWRQNSAKFPPPAESGLPVDSNAFSPVHSGTAQTAFS